MDYFKHYIKTLPQALPEEEQKNLLIEYYETHNESIQQKLLEHNLRLCVSIAEDLYHRYNQHMTPDELFSLCYEELYKALDRYNPYNDAGASFKTFAGDSIKLKLIRPLSYGVAKKLSEVDTHFINDEDEQDLFMFLSDTSESHVAEDTSEALFIQDISNFIDTLKHGNLLKMYLGLGFPRRFLQSEIAREAGVSRQTTSIKINSALTELKNYIKTNYSLAFPDYFYTAKTDAQNFSNMEDRNKYVFDSYYNLNGMQAKNIQQLADEFNLTPSQIKNIIYTSKNNLSKEEQTKLNRVRIDPNSHTDQYKEIFDSYYGVKDGIMLSQKEIFDKYNVGLNSMHYVIQYLIKNGIYTQEEVDQFKQARKILKKSQNTLSLYKPAYVYFSYYGENGYTQKSKVELYREMNLTINTINDYIQLYKEHLNSLSPEEKEAELAKYAKHSELE